MIYLLRKHDIISVPSYAAGIYHPPKVDIISKIYLPFRKERISLKTPSLYHNEGVFMAEKEGFEPSIPFWGIHDFQSCALGQLRDFSMRLLFCSQLVYNTPFVYICQVLKSKICHLMYQKSVDIKWNNRYNNWACSRYASVAQSVVHLTRNEKVACSSQVTSSRKKSCSKEQDFFQLNPP